jgi:hypothetical protein
MAEFLKMAGNSYSYSVIINIRKVIEVGSVLLLTFIKVLFNITTISAKNCKSIQDGEKKFNFAT